MPPSSAMPGIPTMMYASLPMRYPSHAPRTPMAPPSSRRRATMSLDMSSMSDPAPPPTPAPMPMAIMDTTRSLSGVRSKNDMRMNRATTQQRNPSAADTNTPTPARKMNSATPTGGKGSLQRLAAWARRPAALIHLSQARIQPVSEPVAREVQRHDGEEYGQAGPE